MPLSTPGIPTITRPPAVKTVQSWQRTVGVFHSVKFRPIIASIIFALSAGGISPCLWPSFSQVHAASFVAQSAPQDLEVFQGYLDPAPGGMDVRYAWTLPGGRGENVTIVDIEVNWNLKHNDLAAATADLAILVRGPDPQPELNVNHGAAVLGELVAAADGVGVTGIAHRARLGLVSPVTDANVEKVADAITRAARNLQPGDVILVESQTFAGPHFNPLTGAGLAPVEYETPIFEAILAATSRGIVVVEPAANGSDDLDHPDYRSVFDRAVRDSGAIMVGAGKPPAGYGKGPDRARTDESNFGSRVDVQGWGRGVVTCGFGDLRSDDGENNWYTDRFGATSGASAMVAGAAAVIQSIVKARGQEPLSPMQLRRLLAATGTPQGGDLSENIGPRPDLKAAMALLDTDSTLHDPKITALKFKGASGKLIVDGENFIPADSIVEIGGTPVARLKYPSSYFLPGGTTTRIMTKGDISALLPRGVDVAVTVFTPSSGRRSLPYMFRRN